MGKQLTKYGQDLLDSFEEDHCENGCCCHLGHPPCSFCLHPGNPANLEEDPKAYEEEQWWFFTFGFGHVPYNQNYYIKFYGTYASARDRMVERFGAKWSFQYPTVEAAGVSRFNLIEVKQ